MTTIEEIIEVVNEKARQAGQPQLLVYTESTTPLSNVDAVEFTCVISVPSGKEYKIKRRYMEPSETFIDLAKDELLGSVLYDLLNT